MFKVVIDVILNILILVDFWIEYIFFWWIDSLRLLKFFIFSMSMLIWKKIENVYLLVGS